MLKLFFIAFLVLPVVEIYILVQVGQDIGAWQTVGAVVLMALLGVIIIKAQGFMTLRRVQDAMVVGRLPAMEMLESVVLVISGVLFIIPGFLTDAVALVMMLPPVRRAVIRSVLKRARIVPMGTAGASPFHTAHQQNTSQTDTPKSQNVIEGEFRRDE